MTNRLRTSLLLACVGVSLSCRRTPSAEDKREIARLSAVRDTIRAQIDSIKGDSGVPRESLLGAIHHIRVQLLHVTDDLLRNRSEALSAGADFKYQESAFKPDRSRADSLELTIKAQRDSLAAAERRMAQFGDGSIMAALGRMQLETLRLTIDMLEMSRVSALYGIGLPPLLPDSMTAPRRARKSR